MWEFLIDHYYLIYLIMAGLVFVAGFIAYLLLHLLIELIDERIQRADRKRKSREVDDGK